MLPPEMCGLEIWIWETPRFLSDQSTNEFPIVPPKHYVAAHTLGTDDFLVQEDSTVTAPYSVTGLEVFRVILSLTGKTLNHPHA